MVAPTLKFEYQHQVVLEAQGKRKLAPSEMCKGC